MGNIKFEVIVNAPLQQVWDLGRTASRIPEWQFDISSVEDCPGQVEQAGTRYILIYMKAGRRLASPVEVTRYEPEKHFIETTGKTPIGGYFRSSTRMESEGSSTRVMWNMDYELPGGFIGRALDIIIFREGFRRTVRRYIANLKALAEREAAITAER